jgi:tetratricopeptide (TPR) repeat protein
LKRALAFQERAAPTAVPEIRRLASLRERNGQSKEAVELYEKVLKLRGGDIIALNNAAVLYAEELKRPDRAVELAKKANSLKPFTPAIEDTLGTALLRRGRKADLQEALVLLRRASQKLDDPSVRYHYAEALLLTGQEVQARPILLQLSQDQNFEKREAAKKLLE